eukprot:gene41914-56761_t
MPNLPLSDLRVVEIGSGDALSYCGKLFADFGAVVIKVEPSGGDPLRHVAPMVDAGDGRSENGTFAWLNTNKRSITADLDRPADVERIRALLATADLLIDGRPPSDIASSLLTHDALRDSQPGLAITALSWFGEHGPYRDYQATDSVCRSLAGSVKLVGPKEGPPSHSLWLQAVGVLLIAAGGGLWAWSSRAPADDAAGATAGHHSGGPAQAVSAAPVRRQDVRVMVAAIGSMAASNTAVVRAQVSGVLQSLNFREGLDQVERLATPHLADRNAVGPQAKAGAHQIGKRRDPVPCPQRDQIWRGALQLARILDEHDPVGR